MMKITWLQSTMFHEYVERENSFTASMCLYVFCVTPFMFILSNETSGDESDTESWSSKEEKQINFSHQAQHPKKPTVVLPVFPQLSLPSTTSFALGIFRTDSDMITVDNIMSEYNNILEVGQISDCSNCL